MATNHQHHRRSHEALLRQRRHQLDESVRGTVPFVAGKVHKLLDELDHDSKERRDDTESLQRRQVTIELPWTTFTRPGLSLPTFDPFPPVLPDEPSSTISSIEVTSSSSSSLPLETSSTTTSSTTSVVIPETTSTSSTTSTPSTTSTQATTSTSSALSRVTSPPATTVTSFVRSVTPSASASDVSASGAAEATTGVGAGPIVGGIIGGIAGIAAIAFIVAFILRRRRKKEEGTFDPTDFRRSAMLMPDPPTHEDTVARGYNPPPPPMTQRGPGSEYGGGAPVSYAVPPHNDYGYNANPGPGMSPPGYGYNNPEGYYSNGGYNGDRNTAGPNFAGFGSPGMAAGQQPGSESWAPGQVVGMSSHYAANPFMNPAPYNESPFSPLHSPVSPMPPQGGRGHFSQDVHAMPTNDAQGQAGAVERTGTVLAQIGGAAVLTRAASQKSDKAGQLSISVPEKPVGLPVVVANYPELARQASLKDGNEVVTPADLPPLSHQPSTTSNASAKRDSETIPTNDYADLSRASVTPFQAAQYAEISKRLNADVPKGMPSPMVEQYVNAKRDQDLPPIPPPSPLTPITENHNDTLPPAPIEEVRNSTDSVRSLANARAIDFPIPPPSPALTFTSKHRVDSTPPRLPEIAVESRVSIQSFGSSGDHHATYDYHKSYTGLNPGAAFPSGITAGGSPYLNKFPMTPSPLASSFAASQSQEPAGSGLRNEVRAEEPVQVQNAQAEVQQGRVPAARAEVVAGKRPETLYDPEDAYGGI